MQYRLETYFLLASRVPNVEFNRHVVDDQRLGHKRCTVVEKVEKEAIERTSYLYIVVFDKVDSRIHRTALWGRVLEC